MLLQHCKFSCIVGDRSFSAADEKTLKIELSPIPQAYPLKRVSDLSCGRVVYRVEKSKVLMEDT